MSDRTPVIGYVVVEPMNPRSAGWCAEPGTWHPRDRDAAYDEATRRPETATRRRVAALHLLPISRDADPACDERSDIPLEGGVA